MFRKLCGDEALRNVVIVTNMWNEVDPTLGEDRERELRAEDLFFKPILEHGAQMARHDNTSASAESILLRFIDSRPVTLRIQRELADEGLDISETAAGAELTRHLTELARKHEAQLEELQLEMEEAVRAKDEQAQRELASVRADLIKNSEKIETDRSHLSQGFAEDRRHAALRVREVREALQNQERDRIQHDEQIRVLMEQLERSRRASAAERGRLIRQIEQLRRANFRRRSIHGLFAQGAGIVGFVVDIVRGIFVMV